MCSSDLPTILMAAFFLSSLAAGGVEATFALYDNDTYHHETIVVLCLLGLAGAAFMPPPSSGRSNQSAPERKEAACSRSCTGLPYKTGSMTTVTGLDVTSLFALRLIAIVSRVR